MMYNNKLAIAVKSNGKVLREFGDIVYVPFGSEYTLLIKNLSTVRAQVRVQIDGTDATEGCSLVIAPNQSMELTRFIKEGNLNRGNRFKFIERTAAVEQHRGIGVEDGLIRIEYQFEYVSPPVFTGTNVWPDKYKYVNDIWYSTASSSPTYSSNSALRSVKTKGIAEPMNLSNATMDSYFANSVGATSAQASVAGITVPGSISEQRFSSVGSFPVESTKHVMVIKLLGETENGHIVEQPITVKTKAKCPTCGHLNKAKAKFCTECGTGLQIA